MGKSRKEENKKKELLAQAPKQEEAATPIEEATQETNEELDLISDTQTSQEEIISLHDAARRFCVGYKEHWWPSIRKHADTLAFGTDGTADECKAILLHWGARLS